MLPAHERLRKSSVFQRAYTGRKSVNSRVVTLYVVPRAKEQRKAPSKPRLPFVGFVAAKKVLKSAVSRNRVKRRVREAYRLLTRSLRDGQSPGTLVQNVAETPRYKLGQWYVLVFVLHANALEASWEEILKAVDDCLTKAETKHGVVRNTPAQGPARPSGGTTGAKNS